MTLRYVPERISRKRAAAGRAGAAVTHERHADRLSEWGKRGGRPRLPTIEELEARAARGAAQ